MSTWHTTKKWGQEIWTLTDAQNYVGDNINRIHEVEQGVFGWVQSNITVPAAGMSSSSASILPYTPNWNGAMRAVLLMDYISTVSGAPTYMQAQPYIGSSASYANLPRCLLNQYMMTLASNLPITSGVNPTLHVDAIVDTGSIKVNIAVICWIVGIS